MKNLLKDNDREAILARLQNLTAQHRGKWGKLTVEQILPHLTDPLRVAIGEKNGTPQNSPLYDTFLGRIMYRFVPWPKGAPTDPCFLPGTGMTDPIHFEQDKQTLILTIHRFAHYNQPVADSLVFGPMSHHDWGRLMWRHLDHHLRQFGV